MRWKVTLLVWGVAAFGATLAGSQEARNDAAKGAQNAPPEPEKKARVIDPATARQQAVFWEWAKAIRESVDASKKLKTKRHAERRAWAMRTAKAKEDKIRASYRLDLYQLFRIIKRGVAEKWPTDKPEDFAIVIPIVVEREASLDAFIFESELNVWVEAHVPPTGGSFVGPEEAGRQSSTGVDIRGYLRRIAPLTVCGAKLPDGKTCTRQVVGVSGWPCYEHRAPAN
jgi:hypothetical protein